MLTVVYDPSNFSAAVPDDNAEMTALCIGEDAMNGVEILQIVSNFLVIMNLRLLVKRGIVSHTAIQFKYGDTIVTVDIHGQLSSWPKGFGDHEMVILADLARR